MRESTLERAAAEPRECADYPLLLTHPPNFLYATWRTCTHVQLAEDYHGMSPHATCDLTLSIWILLQRNAFPIRDKDNDTFYRWRLTLLKRILTILVCRKKYY